MTTTADFRYSFPFAFVTCTYVHTYIFICVRRGITMPWYTHGILRTSGVSPHFPLDLRRASWTTASGHSPLCAPPCQRRAAVTDVWMLLVMQTQGLIHTANNFPPEPSPQPLRTYLKQSNPLDFLCLVYLICKCPNSILYAWAVYSHFYVFIPTSCSLNQH